MAIDKIKKVMENINCKGFMMQTNGLLLDKLDKEYINKLHTILVSIDGDKEITDKNRGIGVYDRVMKNISMVKKEGFKGELIARMTISKGSSVYKQVLSLLDNGFDSIHWQLDVLFYKEEDTSWLEGYNKEISQLINFWVEKMKEGKVLKLYPFVVITDSLLKGEKSKLRCGSGHSNYTIMTNGKIVPCPIMGGMKEYYIGDLNSKELKEINLGEPCNSCDILDKCGGRCLYTNLTKNWSEEGEKEVCNTVRHLVTELENKKEEINSLITNGIISLEDFSHLKYNGVEVIP